MIFLESIHLRKKNYICDIFSTCSFVKFMSLWTEKKKHTLKVENF